MDMRELDIINDMPRGWSQGKDSPLWHRKVYDMWRDMWRRVYSRIHWFGCLIHPDFKYLSNFVEWIMNQPQFEEFCNTCDKISWSVDKDIKDLNNRNYYPEFMTLTTQSENSKERINRCGNSFKKDAISVIGIKHDSIILLNSTLDGKARGFGQSNISKCINKKRKTHKGYKWYRINYKHNLRLRRVQ